VSIARTHKNRRQPRKRVGASELEGTTKKPIRWRYKRNKPEELRNSRFEKKSEDRIVKKDVFSQKRSSILFVVFLVVCSLFFGARGGCEQSNEIPKEKISFAFVEETVKRRYLITLIIAFN
jgi:hypothetical protein